MSFTENNGVYLADTARVMGEVTLGRDCNVWYAAVVRGDVAPITVGDETNIQDGAVLHCDHGVALSVGSGVTIGHNAIVHGISVGDNALIGMGATLLGGTKIGNGAIVAAGAVLSPGKEVPDGMVAMGIPAKVVREVTDAERQHIFENAEHYVELAKLHAQRDADEPRTKAFS